MHTTANATAPGRPRPSPNRRRLIGRMVFWNLAVMIAVVGLPILL